MSNAYGPRSLDLDDFRQASDRRRALYGLPQEVSFCLSCVMSNQKPNSEREFLSDPEVQKETMVVHSGECSACSHARTKELVDWDARGEQLEALCDRFRGDGSSFDCLIPGSGGKDSVYAAALMRDRYGMTPLTYTWAPHIYTDWGRRNHSRWIAAGFSNVLHTPNERVHRVLTRLALEVLGHPFQPFILGQMAGVPRVAKSHGIRFVVYGESNVEYGNQHIEAATSQKPAKYYTSDSSELESMRISGVLVRELIERFGMRLAELSAYLPLSHEQVLSSGIEVHNLSHFVKWHPQECFYFASDFSGFEPSPERNCGTYSRYSSLDDKLDDLHYWTTFLKFGLGRASYDASQEIRSGVIDRDEGVDLVRRFDGEYPSRFMPELLDYLSLPKGDFPEVSRHFASSVIDEEYLQRVADGLRSPHLWDYHEGGFKLRYRVDYSPAPSA